MDGNLYRQYLKEYVSDAIANSDGTNSGISQYLSNIVIGGFLTRHKDEKKRALLDARVAFDEHRHWPREIVISHLGLDLK
jgi:hypothetical protein